MSHIITKAQQLSVIIDDALRAPQERVWLGCSALSGLVISDLAEGPRAEFETQMVAINQITANYEIHSGDDYKQLTDDEAQESLSRLGTVKQLCIDAEAERVMHELATAGRKLPVAAIKEVRKHPDVFVPLLIRELEKTVATIRSGAEPEKNACFFALFLLTELRVDVVLPIVVDALRLPDDWAYKLFGDAVHELVPPLIAQFFDGNFEALNALIRDTDIDMHVRWSVAQTYTFLVRDELISRDAAISALHGLFQHCMATGDYCLLAPLAWILGDLAAEPALETIRSAYQKNLVDESMIDLESIESQIAAGEETIKDTLESCPPSGMPDTIEVLQSWGSFQERPSQPSSSPKPTPTSSPAPKGQPNALGRDTAPSDTIRVDARVGRNDPCPCGSGKKFKKCCL